MFRPGFGLVVAIFIPFSFTARLEAQALSSTFSEAPSHTSTSTITTTTPTPSSSPMDFSSLSWRIGQISPYTQPTVTSSATTQAVVPAPSATPSNTNPFIGSTLAMHGSLLTPSLTSALNTTSSSIQLSQAAPSMPAGISTQTYAPRFISFASLTPTNGVNPSLVPPVIETGSTLIRFMPTDLNAISPTSIPEPGTLFLCGGLLAIVGYGYSRRREKTQITEPPATSEGEASEAIVS